MIVKPQTCVLYRGEVNMVRVSHCTEIPLIEVWSWQSLTKGETLHFYSHTRLGIRTCVHLCVGDDFSILFSYIISLFSCDSPFSAPFMCWYCCPKLLIIFEILYAEMPYHEDFAWLIISAAMPRQHCGTQLYLFWCCSDSGGFYNEDGMDRWEWNLFRGQVHRQLVFSEPLNCEWCADIFY